MGFYPFQSCVDARLLPFSGSGVDDPRFVIFGSTEGMASIGLALTPTTKRNRG
jgi:hypothetical protein